MNTIAEMIYEGMIEALVFTDCNDDTHEGYTDDCQLSDDLHAKIKAYAEKLMAFEGVANLIEDFCKQEHQDYTRVGHLVWYSSQGHGVGFFDYSGDAAEKLDAIFDDWRTWYLDNTYIGDDGNMYI